MRRRTNGRLAATAAVLLLGVLAAGPVLAADASVTIADFAFAPGTVTIGAGDSVTWTNQDGVDHTATGTGFDTEALGTGESSTITFPIAGSFAYACAIHPTMRGEVIVEAAAPAPSEAAGPTEAGATPASTDTMPVAPVRRPDVVGSIAVLLAVFGVSMLAATIWTSRRDRRSSRPPEDGPPG